jgi:hypothetical protein
MPTFKEIAEECPVEIAIDVREVVTEERNALQRAIDSSDLPYIIARYPIRETPALDKIASELGFKSRSQYESAVRKLLIDDGEALEFVRSFFGTLWQDLANAINSPASSC